MNVRAALKGQYHAALGMLREAVEKCPQGMWDGSGHEVPFWRVVYHTLYAAHMYLQPNEAGFSPWEGHRLDYNDLPWPPGSGPTIDAPYSREQMIDYWRLVDGRVDGDVDQLDLEAAESGFPWHQTMSKFEHQIHNIRHVQHHAAMLSGRLRLANGIDVRWVRRDGEVYKA